MPALIEDTHSIALTAKFVGTKFSFGAGRRLSTAELRLWKPDREAST